VAEVHNFTLKWTTDQNAFQLLSGVTVLIEAKYLLTGYYLNPFDLEPDTKETMHRLLSESTYL
jgi:hypothetical protein